MRKNVLFGTDIEFDCRCVDEKNSNEGKGFIIGGKWKNVKMGYYKLRLKNLKQKLPTNNGKEIFEKT